jgi:outer membrane immunogenic protein
MRRILCAITIALGQAGIAAAADLPARPAPETGYIPNYVWSGLYLGVYGGGQWGRVKDDTGVSAASTTGGLAGGIVGGNFQTGNIVFGFEGDFGGGVSSGSNVGAGGIIEKGDIRGVADFRGRVGWAFDRLLLFAAAGGSFSNPAITRFGVPTPHWLAGWTAGAGVDYAFATHWFARIEYLYGAYSSRSYSFTPADNHVIQLTSLHTLRAALFYKF